MEGDITHNEVFHHMAGQNNANAHYKTHRGALRAPPGAHRGPLGLWVLLCFRLALAGHVVEIPRTIRSPFRVPECAQDGGCVYVCSAMMCM